MELSPIEMRPLESVCHTAMQLSLYAVPAHFRYIGLVLLLQSITEQAHAVREGVIPWTAVYTAPEVTKSVLPEDIVAVALHNEALPHPRFVRAQAAVFAPVPPDAI